MLRRRRADDLRRGFRLSLINGIGLNAIQRVRIQQRICLYRWRNKGWLRRGLLACRRWPRLCGFRLRCWRKQGIAFRR